MACGGKDHFGFPQFVLSKSGQTGFSSSKFGKFHIVCKKIHTFFSATVDLYANTFVGAVILQFHPVFSILFFSTLSSHTVQ